VSKSSYPRFQRARDFKFFTRTAGDLTINSTTWANLPTIGTTWDITLTAQVGDTVEVGFSALLSPEAVVAVFDAVTVVSGSLVNSVASQTTPNDSYEGVAAWFATSSVAVGAGGVVMYTLLAGDVSAGTVTLRPRYRTSTATNRTLNAATNQPLQFWAKNLGPMDPN
jgi:hypothetical protein